MTASLDQVHRWWRAITSSRSRCTVLVIPTNEELSIARQAAQTLT